MAGVQGTWGPPEDYTGGGSGYVGPGSGGQSYDAEAIYFTYDETYAYFGVVTGFPPTGIGSHRPGDIALDFLAYGSWDFGIETTGNNGHVLGGLYATDNGDWKTPSYSSSFPLELKHGGSLAWNPDSDNMYYLNTTYGCEHYFIETAVPLSQLPLSDTECTPFEIHWTMSCGNDVVEARVSYCPPPSTQDVSPEPATCTMLGGGLLAALALRKRRRNKSKTKQTA